AEWYGQVPHWLFAFDAVTQTAMRTLAMLAAHPLHAIRVREERTDEDQGTQPPLPYLRACVLETARLWPTTLVVLRDSTTATSWRGRIMPGQTSVVIVSSFFHRDPTAVAYADRFVPPIWLDGRGEQQPGFVPFSAGPARCPGENLVLFTASAFL